MLVRRPLVVSIHCVMLLALAGCQNGGTRSELAAAEPPQLEGKSKQIADMGDFWIQRAA